MKRRKQIVLGVLVVVLLALLVKGCLVGRHVYALWKYGRELKGMVYNPGALLRADGAARLESDLRRVEQALRGLHDELGPALRLGVPSRSLQANMAAVDQLLVIGADLAGAGQTASQGMEPVARALQASPSQEAGQNAPTMNEAVFAGLAAGQGSFQQAGLQVERLSGQLAPLTTDRLWQPLAAGVALLNRYLPLGAAGLQAAAAAPALLGETQPATYLILAQNNDELRATGGFITGMGLLTLEHGKIVSLTIQDSYSFDQFTVEHPWPPEPMLRYMGIEQWATRDGNWSPDFPTTAKDIVSLFHIEHTTPISGMVAFDLQALQAFVQAVGPLQLPDETDPIDGNNVLQKMRDSWGPQLPEGVTWEQWLKQGWSTVSSEWWVHRKDLMGTLAKALLAKVQGQGKPEQLSALVWAVKHALDEKHILMNFQDPALQAFLMAGGWEGTLDRTPRDDYLLVLDTNMGYNKVNLNVEKRIDYEVTLVQDAAPQATLTITWENHSPPQAECKHGPRLAPNYAGMAQDCYWNYLRVYAPAGSQLLAAEGVTQTEKALDEAGKTVFATFLVVPANESRTVRLTYALPAWHGRDYEVFIQKQAGTGAVPCTVRLNLPPGMRITQTSPAPSQSRSGLLRYDLDLREDRVLTLKLE